jgi:hypothetical protein
VNQWRPPTELFSHPLSPRAGAPDGPGPGRSAEAAARAETGGRTAPVQPRRRPAVEPAAVPGRAGTAGLGARGLVPARVRPRHALDGAG